MAVRVHRCALILPAVAALALVAATAAAQAPEKACDLPPDTIVNEPALEGTQAALTAGQAVHIVAVGGASTQGRAAGDLPLAWPARLAVALRGRFPAAKISVTNLGVPRQTAAEMLARIERQALPLRPTLVIWETGTTDAVRGEDPAAFRDIVQTGIDRLRAASVEVVLMDMQFSRRVMAVVKIDRYRHILRELADINDVALFRRHEIMRHWAESGVFDFNVVNGDRRQAMAARLYDCIGRAVAELVAPSDPPPAQGARR